ncbi:MAG: hypothetical protein PHU31_04765 [Anaerotignum sp.]|nr:hypothetical protein [Anaerotignum sp.]
MKYQKKQEMKKKMLAILALVMAIVMVLSLIAPFTIFAAPMTKTAKSVAINNNGEETETDDTIGSLESFGMDRFTVELQAGFDENYIVKKAMPVGGVVTNHGEAFHGEVQIKAYTRLVGMEKEYAVYYQKLDLEQGASKSIDLEATMGSIHKYIEVSLVDENGNKVFQDYVFLTAKDPNTVMIGVLSDSTQDLKYLNNLHLAQMPEEVMKDQRNYQTELNKNYDFPVFLDEKTFPKSIGIMDSFTVFIIDDFDASVLSKPQLEALAQWVLEGGTLLVGTGASAQKTLQGLDFLSEVKVEGVTTVPELEGVSGDISLAKLSGEKLSDVWLEQGNGAFSAVEMGKGHVVLSHFSLSATPMAGQSATLSMLQEALNQAAVQSLTIAVYDNGGNYDRLQYMASDFPPFEMSSISFILGAIIVYILITGPLLYVILKKKDKREKGWIIVPAISVLFMGLVFFLAQSSSYKNGMIHTIGFVEMQEGSTVANADIGMAIKSSGKGDVTFTSDEKMPLNINTEENYYEDGVKKDKCAYRILCGDTTEVEFPDAPSWETQYISTQKSVDLGGNVESNIVMKDGNFVGEIINHTNVDFHHVILLLNDHMQEFDQLKAGETLEIDISEKELKDVDDVLYKGYDYQGVRDQVANGEMTRYEAYLKYEKLDLLQQYYVYQGNSTVIPVTFFGFSEAPILSGEKKVNGARVLENNLSMYMQDFPLELSKQEDFQLELSGTADAPVRFDNYDYETESAVYPFEESDFYVTYSIPEGIRIDSMEIQALGERGALIPSGITMFNNKTMEWDGISLETPVDAENYIDESNQVQIMMHCLKEREWAVPELLIQGGGLFVEN